ncbi:MAG: hypothetical protein AB8E82_00580 [Aureispira sp.]
MVASVPIIPYLYAEEGISLTTLEALLREHNLEAVPEKRYYYNYKDAIRIIDFIHTNGIYDGWVLLIQPKDRYKANQLVNANPQQFCLYEEVEYQFLGGLSNVILQQIVGSEHAVGKRLELIQILLKERGIFITKEKIAKTKRLVQIRNEEQQIKVLYIKIVVWTTVVLMALVYFWLIGLWH